MALQNLPSGTVTFLFTDIEGSTKVAQQFPQQWETLRVRHHAILHQAMQAHDGFVFQIIGDAFCVAFYTATDALNAAVLAQRLFLQEPWSPAPIKIRIGINTGAAQVSGDDPRSGGYTGYTSLVRVERVMSAAHGDQILISNTSAELLRGELATGITLRDMGEHRLKGILNPERLWQVIAPDLPQDFPPLQTLNSIPNNLPIQLTSFVGREKEIAQIKESLTTTRLLTLTGAGGTGKTRLSLQVAAEVLDTFKNGVWSIELAPLSDPILVPNTVANVLGVHEEPGRPLMATLLDYLRAKQLLLILDNCEHLIEACAKFADAVLRSSPDVRILASSREALGIAGELAWRVSSLPTPDPKESIPIKQLEQYAAVRLFIDRATFALARFTVTNTNAPTIAQICYRLDGIPLAIELAAARVKALSVEQIAARLDDRFRLLTSGSRTALPRQQTLRAAIDWSHSLLTENERVLLRRLAVFAGGWTLESAQAVCSCDPVCAEDVLDLLARLVDKSLVNFEQRDSETRYRLMETIRQYARDRLMESTEAEEIRDRHLDFFVALAEEGEVQLRSRDQLAWLSCIEIEHDNLRVALDWSLAGGRVERGLRIAAALGSFWQMRGYWSEGRQRIETLLKQPGALSRTMVRAKVLWVLTGLGRSKSQRQNLEELIDIARELGDASRPVLALGLGRLSQQYIYNDDPVAARAMVEEGVAIARASGDSWTLARVLFILGIFLTGTREDTVARAKFEESRRLFQSVGDQRWAMRLSGEITELKFRAGDIAAARSEEEQALRYFREIKDNENVRLALTLLGEMARAEGNYELAKTYYLQALEIARAIGGKSILAIALSNLGFVLLQEGVITLAKKHFAECMNLTRELNSQVAICMALRGYASLAAAEKHAHLAVRLFAAVQTLQEQTADRRSLSPADDAEFARNLAIARAQLDEATFNAAWADGQKMTMEQAIEYALAE